MRNRRNYRKTDKKNYPIDKKGKHEEVLEIKRNLVNYAQTSWGKQWIHAILKIGRPYRMRRGINYAKDEERLSNLQVNKGEIFSMVQGTAPTPYRVRIKFKQISEEDWKTISNQISQNLLNLIDLLEGKLSDKILGIFEAQGYSLFPDISEGLDASCSCPDKAIPCKHIAATILYISRVVDYEPLILLKLRGKTKKEILAALNIGGTLTFSDEADLKEERNMKEIEEKYSFEVPKISIKDLNNKSREDNSINDVDFQFRKPSKMIQTLENLGLPPNLENPKAFSIVFEKIYRRIMKQAYDTSMKSN
ncbi:MAG: hypothetical protein GF317_07495 [Candidatus Lokiarchaeota archaeon]|nr:hypothetical protein [Candidatus Lokiarchaeota archaeon]MBD3199553.1 hypothetical protein [Candidatus Lokiarchaeota archaeon]